MTLSKIAENLFQIPLSTLFWASLLSSPLTLLYSHGPLASALSATRDKSQYRKQSWRTFRWESVLPAVDAVDADSGLDWSLVTIVSFSQVLWSDTVLPASYLTRPKTEGGKREFAVVTRPGSSRNLSRFRTDRKSEKFYFLSKQHGWKWLGRLLTALLFPVVLLPRLVRLSLIWVKAAFFYKGYNGYVSKFIKNE